MPGGRREEESEKQAEQTTPASNRGEQEGHKVYLWRLEKLSEAGMPTQLAKRVAESNFDLHVALKALAAGCPPETLLDIAL